MVKEIFYILIAYGMTNILVYGEIFNSLRCWAERINPKFLGSMLKCSMCTGFWVGIFLSLIVYSPTSEIFGYDKIYFVTNPIALFLDACFASGMVWLITNFEEMLSRISAK